MAPRAAQAMITAAAALLLIGQAMRHRPLELRRQLREVDAPAVGASARECAAVGLRSDGDARGRCKGDVTGDMTLGEFKSCDTSDSDRATRRE